MPTQAYDQAASVVLDTLWADREFRHYFHQHDYTLPDLGPLLARVFVPAYLRAKEALRGGPLELLEAQVTQDLLTPLYDQPTFREAWDQWDAPTRDAFLREQSEMALAQLLVATYPALLSTFYREAFRAFLAGE